MGRSCRRLLIGLLAPLALGAAEGFDAEAFSPTDWPGKAPEAVVRAARPLMQDLLVAMRAQSTSDQRLARDRLIAALGRYAGVPEERPVYGQPIDPTPPNRERLEPLWRAALVAQDGRNGWEQARQREVAPGEGGKVPRLRVSERQIRALLQTHEAGLDPDGAFLRRARQGLDYLLSTQSTGGVFGFPHDPGGPGLRKAAAAVVERGRSRGQTLVERGWVIEDLGDGGLNFDHGMCGALMIHGYAVTGEPRYFDAAVRAGQWARGRPLGPNFNYNGFLGVLLARLYRATGDASWLEAARAVFQHGVLPGQLPNGRWLDQHNAKIQYHAILCAQLGEYLLALRLAQDPALDRVTECWRRALDNLAAEIVTYGTNNGEEALSLLALSFAARLQEPPPAWTQAAAIVVNHVTGPRAARPRSAPAGGPESLAAWLLWSRPPEAPPGSAELRNPLRPLPTSPP